MDAKSIERAVRGAVSTVLMTIVNEAEIQMKWKLQKIISTILHKELLKRKQSSYVHWLCMHKPLAILICSARNNIRNQQSG